VQIIATKDYAPLKAILNEREWKKGAAAATWHESGGVDEKGEAGSLSLIREIVIPLPRPAKEREARFPW